MPTKTCDVCKADMTYKEGYSKQKNKPWAGWFCSNAQCKKVVWATPGQSTPQKSDYQTTPNTNDYLLEGINLTNKILTEMYKVDVAIYKEIVKNKNYGNGQKTDNGTSQGGASSENSL